MNHILLLSSMCFESANANGICANKIFSALKQRNKVDVALLGYSQDKQKSSVRDSFNKYSFFYLNKKRSKLSQKLFHYWEAVVKIIRPFIRKQLVKLYVKNATQVIKDKGIETIVAFYYPIETVVAMLTLKRKFPFLQTIIFELDSAVDGVSLRSKGAKLFHSAYIRWLKKAYRNTDSVIVMKSHEQFLKTRFGGLLGDKLNISDLPMLDECVPPIYKTKKTTDFLYSGLLNSHYRSPQVLLDLFIRINDPNWHLYFYVRGDCKELLDIQSQNFQRIHYEGYVDVETLKTEQQSADFLINIGNAFSNSVPSKLISYFSFGKPIIHFKKQEIDVCEEYLRDYPLSLVIDERKDIEHNVMLLKRFVLDHLGQLVDNEYIKKKYKMNTPQYSAGLIESLLSAK